ncbi:MAG: hypothetical protein H6732_04350 [Alphaproteobacteria bacterium]|nr:hypothetical protein [Alphaproteobacteria bacterium]
MRRPGPRRVGLLVLVAACDPTVDWTVDATALAASHPDAPLAAILVRQGEVVAEVRIERAADEPVVTKAGVVEVGLTHGVAGWADLDGDGRCHPLDDEAWKFAHEPRFGVPFVWTVQLEVLDSVDGCLAFPSATDTDTDAPDTGAVP